MIRLNIPLKEWIGLESQKGVDVRHDDGDAYIEWREVAEKSITNVIEHVRRFLIRMRLL